MRVVYTSLILTGDGYYKDLDRWKIRALSSIQNFADRHEARLVVVNDEYFYNDLISKGYKKREAATLTSIWAIKDFAKSNANEMMWLDLDCVPTLYSPWIKEHIWASAYAKCAAMDSFSLKKAQFFWEYSAPRIGPTNTYTKVKSCLFALDRGTATRMLDFWGLRGLNVFSDDIGPIIAWAQRNDNFPCDENFLEAFYSYNPPKDTSRKFDDFPDLTGELFTHYGSHKGKI